MNKLFRIEPDEVIIMKILECLSIKNFNDRHPFTKVEIIINNTVNKMIELIPELMIYYYDCISKAMLSNISEVKCITIANHFLRNTEYVIDRIPYVNKQRKITNYKLIRKEDKEDKIFKIVKNEKFVEFD